MLTFPLDSSPICSNTEEMFVFEGLFLETFFSDNILIMSLRKYIYFRQWGRKEMNNMRLMNHINQSGNSATTAWSTGTVAVPTHAQSQHYCPDQEEPDRILTTVQRTVCRPVCDHIVSPLVGEILLSESEANMSEVTPRQGVSLRTIR